MRRVLPTPPDFDFRSAVCSHGFFMLQPNRWDPARATLHTVVTVDDQRACSVAVRAQGRRSIVISGPTGTPPTVAAVILRAVSRMLRLEEDLRPFHKLCRGSTTHAAAARMRFGRLIRGADLFEDMVKVICTCNVTWRQTVTMIEQLVGHWGVPACGKEQLGFPTPARLAQASVDHLRQHARLGYRAVYVHELAAAGADGRLDLPALEHWPGPTESLLQRLRQIRGIGPYAAANLCMLLGRYDCLAIDTELIRLFRRRWPRRKLSPAAIRDHYAPWQPYPFLAYWFELWQDYQQRHGHAEGWSLEQVGRRITSRPGSLPGKSAGP